MEFLLQWLDELDDVVAIVASQAERARRWLQTGMVLIAAAATLVTGVLLALAKPVLAPVLASLLVLSLLYRRQTQRSQTELAVANG